MNPGIPEEAGQTARSFIDAIKTQPHVFGLLAVVIVLLLFMFYALNEAASFRHKLVDQVFQNAKSINEMLQERSVPCPK
jgi:hypothetical protein